MSTLLDTSVLVALFTDDALADRAAARVPALARPYLVSDFAQAEFASALGLKVRRGALRHGAAAQAFPLLDTWVALRCHTPLLSTADIALATGWLRRLDLTLRAPDALHLAIAARLGASVATFDAGMEAAARALALPLAPA